MWIYVEECLGLHDHAIDAVSTLGGLLIDESLLQFVRLAVLQKSCQRGDRPVNSCLRLRHTGSDGFSVDQHGAGTTLGPPAAEFQAILVEVVGENEQQRGLCRCVY
jgi:hypothetical protein